MTLQNEKPELEVRKTELLKQEEDLKIQLAKLEESLLQVDYSLNSCYSYFFNFRFLNVIVKNAE